MNECMANELYMYVLLVYINLNGRLLQYVGDINYMVYVCMYVCMY